MQVFLARSRRSDLRSVRVSDLHFDYYVKTLLKTISDSENGEREKILREM